MCIYIIIINTYLCLVKRILFCRIGVTSSMFWHTAIQQYTCLFSDIPSPLEVQWRSLQTQHADDTAQMLQSLKVRGSEDNSADSAIFMSECSSDNGGTLDCRKETTWISTDVFEETFDFSTRSPPPPPPPRNRSALLDDPIPPPLPSRTSV